MTRPNKGAADRRQQPYEPGPTLVDNPVPAPAPVPQLEFASPEAAATVTTPLREKYENAAAFAHVEWQQAGQCQTDMDAWAQEIDDARRITAEAERRITDRQAWIEQRAGEQRRHMVHGQQACDVANPLAVLLGVAGVHVPTLQAPAAVPAPFPPLRADPLDTSRPLADPAEVEAQNAVNKLMARPSSDEENLVWGDVEYPENADVQVAPQPQAAS